MTDTNTHFEDGCHVVYNLNSLYHAYLAAKKDSDWKPQVQKYEMNFLPHIVKSKAALKDRAYQSKASTEFIISERGKTRPITGYRCLTGLSAILFVIIFWLRVCSPI